MLLAAANPLNASEFIFPALEIFHITGFAMLVGTTAVVDFRLLGAGILSGETPAELARDLLPWNLVGLLFVLFSGPFMFLTDPDMYYLNHSFQAKMALFAAVLLFQYTIRGRLVKAGTAGKLVACVSLALWLSVIAAGVFIAFE